MSTALAVCHGAFGRVTVYRLDKPIRMHAHREAHLTYLLNGAPAVVTVGDIPYALDQTTGIVINPWEPHAFQAAPGPPSTFLVAYLCDRWLDRDQHGRGALRFGANRIDVGTTIRSIAVSLAHVVVTNGGSRIVDRYLNQLFDASIDASWAGSLVSKRAAPGRMPIDFRVRKSLRLLDDNFTQGIELDAVARDVGLSRPHFFKLFRENTGVTPALYANTMRVERALDRLVTSKDSITDIGFELGFSSQSHFTHFFAANVGIAPTPYRAIARVVGD